MFSNRFVHLSLCFATVSAFRDTSPFYLFSTSWLPSVNELPIQLLAKGSFVSSSALDAIQSCPSDTYVIVSQPGALVTDYEQDGTTNLRRWMTKRRDDQENFLVQSAYSVPDVLGAIDVSSLENHLVQKCGAIPTHVDTQRYNIALPDRSPRVTQLVKVDFPELPVTVAERERQVTMQDSFLSTILDSLSGGTFTVIYTTTPPTAGVLASLEQSKFGVKQHAGENTFVESAHIDLKRSTGKTLGRRQKQNSTSDRGLFERYNFLRPGIFEGLIASLILISILYVGISAVSSLQVSYVAFSKEMGPAAQKKQQ